MKNQRNFSIIDQIISVLDDSARTLFSKPQPTRENPAACIAEKDDTLNLSEKKLAGRLMRINHAGEIAAQGLYQGQALTANLADIQQQMQQAADEENDHLAWCRQRTQELNTHTSFLDPIWYAGSVSIGAVAGLAGDKWSLGFVAETENQVVRHLNSHLEKLPIEDKKTRAILEQMKIDEGHHATTALQSGGEPLPYPIKLLMKVASKVMTKTAYWI